MDAISLVVTAFALGASTGLSETTATAIKDAYSALRSALSRSGVDVGKIEHSSDPSGSLREELTAGGDDVGDDVLEAARQLTDAVAEYSPSVGAIIAVDLEDVKAEFLRIESVRSSGTGVRLKRGTFSGGIDIGHTVAGDRKLSNEGSAGPPVQ